MIRRHDEIPLENEYPSDMTRPLDPIVQAAIMHVLKLHPNVSESRQDYLVDLAQRCFKVAIVWYQFPVGLTMDSAAKTCIPVVDSTGAYDNEEIDEALLAFVAAIEWYIKQTK